MQYVEARNVSEVDSKCCVAACSRQEYTDAGLSVVSGSGVHNTMQRADEHDWYMGETTTVRTG